MVFDIIIATYNRQKKVKELIHQLGELPFNRGQIIVVDSTATPYTELKSLPTVTYIHCDIANQPYQRYVGSIVATADWLVFFDDDVEIDDSKLFEKIANATQNPNIVGVAIQVHNRHTKGSLALVPESSFTNDHPFIQAIHYLTGMIVPKPGQAGLCGLRGPQPNNPNKTVWWYGPAYAAKKTALYTGFNFYLYDLYQAKLGKAEDFITSYTLSKQGIIWYDAQIAVWQNDQSDSTYSANLEAYGKRVLFSRLYLSLEKIRLDGTSVLWGYIYFHWFALWRVLGLIANHIIKPSQNRLVMLKGVFNGWRLSWKYVHQYKANSTWEQLAKTTLALNNLPTVPKQPISLIIATYNRHVKVESLVRSILNLTNKPDQIIVVDSTDQPHYSLMNLEGVTYIRSTHKNQPYQRYVGYLAANNPILVYFDDDVEMADSMLFDKIAHLFSTSNIGGIALNVNNVHNQTSISKILPSALYQGDSYIRRIIRTVTAYGMPPNGKLSLCGVKGKQPTVGGYTDYVFGPAFAARKTLLFQNFNWAMLDLFEQKIGMGEDTIIGYTLSKKGRIVFTPSLLVWHNDQNDSTYSDAVYSFTKKVLFSRLFLSLEKTRLDGKKPSIWIHIHYHWFCLWRVIGQIVNYIIDPSTARKENIKGYLAGWKKTITWKFKTETSQLSYWPTEASYHK